MEPRVVSRGRRERWRVFGASLRAGRLQEPWPLFDGAMKHYEVGVEETETEGPTQSHSFFCFWRNHGTPPLFLSCAPKGRAGRRRRSARALGSWAASESQCACAREVVLILQQRVFWGYLFLGSPQDLGSLQVPCSLPIGLGCTLWQGRSEGAEPLPPIRGCLAQTLRPAAPSALGRGCAVSPLARPLDLFPLPGRP